MDELPDYDLQPSPADTHGSPVHPSAPPTFWIVAAASLIIVAAGGAYLFLRVRTPPQAPVAASSRATTAGRDSAPAVLGGEPDSITVPPLDDTDPLVRRLVRVLSHDAVVERWLVSNDLIRSFTVAVANVADGTTPANRLVALRPAAPFGTITAGGIVYIDPRTYDRYDAIAHAVGSLDPIAAAKLYATLKPRIEEAFRELGTAGTFDRTLERAIVVVLATPVGDGPIKLVPKGIGFGFADPRLEGLTGAQRQLLRMGPMNARTIQRSLRDIAVALGVPSEQLPPGGSAATAPR